MTDLRKAAEAVLERWDSPAWEWKKQGPTADLMANLRTALAAEQPKQEPVASDDDEEFTREDVTTLLLEVMDWTYAKAHRNRPMTEAEQKVLNDIRTHLAAEQPKHPGYVIGSHWLETAYSRICAGEAEADVLRDIGLVRITDGMVETADIHAIVDRQEAMRRDAFRKGFYAGFAATAEGWNGEYPFQDKNKPIVGDPSVEAAIDAAMEGKR